MGSVLWEISGLEGRRRWAKAALSTSRTCQYACAEQLTEDFARWTEHDEGRVMALDGWVIART
jgi:hypothetical protein